MTDWQIMIIAALLGAIAGILYSISQQIERVLSTLVYQCELLEKTVAHPDDDKLRCELGTFLEDVNAASHGRDRGRMERLFDKQGEH